MRRATTLTGMALVLMVSCGGSKQPSTNGTRNNVTSGQPAPIKDGIYKGRGNITRIDRTRPSVELNHDNIPGLMPAMLMEFYVRDRSVLDNVKVGDAVDFQIEYKGGQEIIVSIQKLT